VCSSCNRKPVVTSSAVPPAGAKVFHTKGVIRAVTPVDRSVTIEHENIPNFMPSMTMPFHIKNASAMDELKVGDSVGFRFVVTESDSWIDEIHRITPFEVTLPKASASETSIGQPALAKLKKGDKIIR